MPLFISDEELKEFKRKHCTITSSNNISEITDETETIAFYQEIDKDFEMTIPLNVKVLSLHVANDKSKHPVRFLENLPESITEISISGILGFNVEASHLIKYLPISVNKLYMTSLNNFHDFPENIKIIETNNNKFTPINLTLPKNLKELSIRFPDGKDEMRLEMKYLIGSWDMEKAEPKIKQNRYETYLLTDSLKKTITKDLKLNFDNLDDYQLYFVKEPDAKRIHWFTSRNDYYAYLIYEKK